MILLKRMKGNISTSVRSQRFTGIISAPSIIISRQRTSHPSRTDRSRLPPKAFHRWRSLCCCIHHHKLHFIHFCWQTYSAGSSILFISTFRSVLRFRRIYNWLSCTSHFCFHPAFPFPPATTFIDTTIIAKWGPSPCWAACSVFLSSLAFLAYTVEL